MAITYPVDCDNPRKRTEWLYRAQELLRLLHNAFGKWYREGLTQVQYDKFPQKVKNKYLYKPQLSQEDWNKFYREDFRLRNDKICTQINIQRAELKQSTAWQINIEDI